MRICLCEGKSIAFCVRLNPVSDIEDRPAFVFKIYQKHHLKKDKIVATHTDTVDGVLGRLKDGGTKITRLVECCTDAIAAIKVFEENFGKDSSDSSDLSEITFRFGFTAGSREGVNANELQATDALSRTTEGVRALGPTPQVVGLTSSAVDTVANIAGQVQTFENTWGILLKRMELFNTIVADIAQVCDFRCLNSLFMNAK